MESALTVDTAKAVAEDGCILNDSTQKAITVDTPRDVSSDSENVSVVGDDKNQKAMTVDTPIEDGEK
jgi:hypothetical protein